MAKTRTATQRTHRTRTVKALSLKQEQGRRRNNRNRPQGEKVRARSYWQAALSTAQIEELLAGKEVTLNFKNADETLTLAK